MGVKSLWSLLTPVGRPVMLETVEGKIMAIDSSIWIYQFQATMRDKEGRGLLNAHVLGFLRRIAKLLFYGIKPVFVFDGGAPELKRATLNERRKKKSGAAVSHAKLAEKLLAAQMRREALNHTKGKEREEDFVYLEDLEPGAPRTPPAKRTKPSTPASKAKGRFHDHDPYKLPEVDLPTVISKITQPSSADPRLATEDELQSFIEDMRPEDFDTNSPAFRELPTEVQYEIIGDLRLKSRQTSFARLQKMLSTSKTPLDFSKQQIENLRQRNALTQQLLVTTDSIGSAHISIPLRIASERNKEYVLIKNDGAAGGWILGVKDPAGTSREMPIEIDQDDVQKQEDKSEEDSDSDMVEVEIPPTHTMDPDLREWQRENALTGLSNRNTDKGLASLSTRNSDAARKPKLRSNTLFDVNDSDFSDDDVFARPTMFQEDGADEDDDLLAIAIQESMDTAANPARPAPSGQPVASSSSVTLDTQPPQTPMRPSARGTGTPAAFNDDKNGEDMYATPNRLQTALRFAHSHSNSPSVFGMSKLLSAPPVQRPGASTAIQVDSDSDSDMVPVPIPSPPTRFDDSVTKQTVSGDDSDEDMIEILPPISKTAGTAVNETEDNLHDFENGRLPTFALSSTGLLRSSTPSLPKVAPQPTEIEDSDDDMEEVVPPSKLPVAEQVNKPAFQHSPALLTTPPTRLPSPLNPASPQAPVVLVESFPDNHDREDEEPYRAQTHVEGDHDHDHEEFGAADLRAEEGEFAHFVSQVRNRDVQQVRKEIDDEIAALNQQRRNALRDSEDINQQMVNQIMAMLRLFGIPYITAPMEAEAQCAELVSLGLVDGVITDDSDVFLFGAARVFKNMFNQSKTVECFLSSDLERELGLDRDTLIQLAYLLGSDYTDGLPGVGPVVAMELVREFPGKDGLWKFKEWWAKVQNGKDSEKESGSKFRRMFKKKFKDLYIANDWPNTAVRDAYYHPTVDSSDEPFKWASPDLDGLRGFFQDELGWSQAKVDDLLLPIVQKMNKRSQANALNKQGNLNDFLGVPGGSGIIAPRQRQAYASKRLQEVVTEFRKKRQRSASEGRNNDVEEDVAEPEAESSTAPAKKKRKAASGAAMGRKAKAATGKRKAAKGTSKGKGKADDSDWESDEQTSGDVEVEAPRKALRPRPRPRPIPKKVVEEQQSAEE